MKKICSILFILCSMFLFSCTQKKDNTFKVVETYRITSSSGSKSFLSVELPISYGYQKVGEIKIENVDSYYFEQKDGYQTLFAELTGDGMEKIVKISYEVKLLKGIDNWNEDTVNEYLQPSEFIDSDHQTIMNIVKPLIVKDNQYKTAQNISKYVSENIKFDSSTKINQKTLKASEVLENKEGVCGDYANLMTAMLRASGIAAKSISGLVLNDLTTASDWGSPAGSHAWVEFYIDGKWYFDDPTWGNSYFASTDGYHLSYGTQPVSVDSQAYQDYMNEIKAKGFTILGASTAPIKFTAWSEDQQATIIPKVTIKKL